MAGSSFFNDNTFTSGGEHEKPTFISGSRLFRTVTDDESKSGHVADVYFRQTIDIWRPRGWTNTSLARCELGRSPTAGRGWF